MREGPVEVCRPFFFAWHVRLVGAPPPSFPVSVHSREFMSVFLEVRIPKELGNCQTKQNEQVKVHKPHTQTRRVRHPKFKSKIQKSKAKGAARPPATRQLVGLETSRKEGLGDF